MTGEAELRAAVEAWIADDPDPGDRAELQALLDRAFAAAGARHGARDAGAARRRAQARSGRGAGDGGAAGSVRGPAALRDGGAARRGRRGAEPDEPRRGQGRDRRGGRLAGQRGHREPERGGGLRRAAPVGGVRRGGGRGAGGRGHRGAHAAAAVPHSPARVRGPPSGHGGRSDDHRQPQPGRRQRVQALPERRRPGHPARRRRDREAHRRPRAAGAGSGRGGREPADHPARRRDRRGLPGRDRGYRRARSAGSGDDPDPPRSSRGLR